MELRRIARSVWNTFMAVELRQTFQQKVGKSAVAFLAPFCPELSLAAPATGRGSLSIERLCLRPFMMGVKAKDSAPKISSLGGGSSAAPEKGEEAAGKTIKSMLFWHGPLSHLITTMPLATAAGLAAWHVPIFFERGHSFSFVEGFDPYIFVQHGIFIGAFGESFVLATAVALAGASVGLAARFVGQQLAVRGINNSGYSPTKAFENLSLQAQARLYKYLSSVHETASCVVDDLPRQKQSEPGQDYEINDEAEKVRSQRAKQRRARRNQWFEEQLGPKYWGILAPLFHIPSLAGIFTRGRSALPKNP